MPYHIIRQGARYCVAKQDEDTPLPGGCHETEKEAKEHMAALYTNVDDATKAGARHSKGDMELIAQARKLAAQLHQMMTDLGAADEEEEAAEEEGKGVDVEALAALVVKKIDKMRSGRRDPLPVDTEDLFVTVGGEIKSLGDGRFGGYLVRFTDADTPDLAGDFFTKDTDFDFEDGDRATVYYHHGQDKTLGKRKLGVGTLKKDDVGVWIEAQLQIRDAYEKHIASEAQKNREGWSSGTLGYLIERVPVGKAQWIKHWPLGKDASITPTPCAGPEPTRVIPMKAYLDLVAQAGTPALQIDEPSDPPTPDPGRGGHAPQSEDSARKAAIQARLDTLTQRLQERTHV